MQTSTEKYIFFIGTVAEFIKLFPVINAFKEKRIDFEIFASGQNDIEKSEIFSYLNLKKPELTLSTGPKNKTVFSTFVWFLKTFLLSLIKIHRYVKHRQYKNVTVIVHGDTLSTLMGAYVSKLLGFRIVHVEAGLRSFNVLHPFPEEISRVLVSYVVDLHFCPNEWALANIKTRKGRKTNTYSNTLLESLKLAKKVKPKNDTLNLANKRPFFIFIIHRQENLYNSNRLQYFLNCAEQLTHTIHCVLILHDPTKVVLERRGLLAAIINNPNITAIPRQSYFDFMRMLELSEYIITDGGSNQEESFYLGKPCLILRNHTERMEGLGQNVVLWNNGRTSIINFAKNYKKYSREPVEYLKAPSEIICDELLNGK